MNVHHALIIHKINSSFDIKQKKMILRALS